MKNQAFLPGFLIFGLFYYAHLVQRPNLEQNLSHDLFLRNTANRGGL